MNYTQQAPRRKNYTPLPNEVFSLGLSPGELAVYAYLLYCEDRRTYQSWPSYKTIGRAIHRSKGAVKRYVDGLVVKGLITAEPTSSPLLSGAFRTFRILGHGLGRGENAKISRHYFTP